VGDHFLDARRPEIILLFGSLGTHFLSMSMNCRLAVDSLMDQPWPADRSLRAQLWLVPLEIEVQWWCPIFLTFL
jgi:hypothetical protein